MAKMFYLTAPNGEQANIAQAVAHYTRRTAPLKGEEERRDEPHIFFRQQRKPFADGRWDQGFKIAGINKKGKPKGAIVRVQDKQVMYRYNLEHPEMKRKVNANFELYQRRSKENLEAWRQRIRMIPRMEPKERPSRAKEGARSFESYKLKPGDVLPRRKKGGPPAVQAQIAAIQAAAPHMNDPIVQDLVADVIEVIQDAPAKKARKPMTEEHKLKMKAGRAAKLAAQTPQLKASAKEKKLDAAIRKLIT